MAADLLLITLAEYLDEGLPLSELLFLGHSESVFRAVESVKVSAEFIERTKCMTTTEAAKELGFGKVGLLKC